MLKMYIYRTLLPNDKNSLYKDKGSKFMGYAFPINSEEDINIHLNAMKKMHPHATHICYAYVLGIQHILYKTQDDGEPNYSAGMPIYQQIQSFNLRNVLVVVVRYFGGTKLGVGGLINAYKTAARDILESSEIVEREKFPIALIFG